MSKRPDAKTLDVPLPDFDVSRIAPDSVLLFIGKRNTGTSRLPQKYSRVPPI
jgi:hypothetical protein